MAGWKWSLGRKQTPTRRRSRGSLTALGIGIRPPAQTTFEAAAHIERADKVFSLVGNPLAEYWIRKLNRNTESLLLLYAVGKRRQQTYREMVERIVSAVRANLDVCAVSYGHPGVFAYPFHESVRRLRSEGFSATMLAGVSAEDCLFAELGVDPGTSGCRSYEATDFLIRRRGVDTTSSLVLWQIGVVGEPGFKQDASVWNAAGLAVLVDTLIAAYGADHEVVLFEAAAFSVSSSRIDRVRLREVPTARVTAASTMYVPPISHSGLDMTMVQRLGLHVE
jgi:uncharacterized protein YabN with tetrapyrrole methylase and pyrophosphatase domain